MTSINFTLLIQAAARVENEILDTIDAERKAALRREADDLYDQIERVRPPEIIRVFATGDLISAEMKRQRRAKQ